MAYNGRNRRNQGSLIGTIIAFIILINIFGNVFFLVPLVPIIIVLFIVSLIKKSSTATQSDYTPKQEKTFISNHKKMQIDSRLKEYFKTNYRLPIFDDIALVPISGAYTAFEDLYIAKGDETIINLEDFGNRFPTTYDEIVSLLVTFSRQKEEVIKAEVKAPKIEEEDKLSQAEKYIEKINGLNVDIQKEEIKNGLYQTCALLKQIDIAVKDDDDDKIRKLYDYYLPILVKILDNYKTLANVSKDSEDFKDCENQLIKTIILINEALKTINETLHESDYMDLSADITTLQSLLKKDGLVKSGTLYEEEKDDQKGQ